MTLTYLTPNNSQKPQEVTYRLQCVRPSGISALCILPLPLSCCPAPGRFKNASAHPTQRLLMPSLLSHTTTTTRDNASGDRVTVRAEQGCRCHQMLLDLINWVSVTMLFQEVRATGPRQGPMGAQKHSCGQLLRDTENKPRLTSSTLSFPYRSLK